MAVFAGVALAGGLVPDEGDDDLAVDGGLLTADDDQVSGQDARLQHTLAADAQGKAVLAVGVEGDILLHALLSQNGGAGGHVAQQGHPVLRQLGRQLHPMHGGDGPGLARTAGDDAGLLQTL